MRCACFAVVVSMWVPTAARADDAPGVQPYLTVGIVELVGLPPAHLGLYVTASLDLAVPLLDEWQLIGSFGFEFAPDTGHWGGVFLLIADRVIGSVGDVLVALDPQLGLIHDATPTPTGFDHAFYVAGGLGVAFITEHGTWIPQLLVSVGTSGEGVALAPTLLFSVPI